MALIIGWVKQGKCKQASVTSAGSGFDFLSLLSTFDFALFDLMALHKIDASCPQPVAILAEFVAFHV